VENIDGTKVWFRNGKRHRVDGPAVEYADGTKVWYINGRERNKNKFKEIINSK